MNKFFILYLVLGTVALLLFIWQLFAYAWSGGSLVLNGVLAVLFYYLSYKVYHEKKDKELM